MVIALKLAQLILSQEVYFMSKHSSNLLKPITLNPGP